MQNNHIKFLDFILSLGNYCGKFHSIFFSLLLLISCNDRKNSDDDGCGRNGICTSAAPSAPTYLSLVMPSTSPGLNTTPTISVDGVEIGDTVKIFSDSNCTFEIGSEISPGTSVNITVNSALSISSHSIYANSTNAFGTSPCSTSYVSYTIPLCPDGFILVPHNSGVGTTSDFCVMKYEAKNNGGVAISQASGNPYVSLTIGASQAKCTDLNALNEVSDKFDLISNPEWMTIVRNAEGIGANWEAGIPGSGAMFRGHSDGSPSSALAAALDNDPYTGTGNDSTQVMNSGKEQKRTLTLSNGEVIWDLSGNVWEWVDWSLDSGLQESTKTCAGGSWIELPNVTCGELSQYQYMPNLTNLTSTNGVGLFYGGGGGAAIRGGRWDSNTGSGAFGLFLNNSRFNSNMGIGFRCVYRH